MQAFIASLNLLKAAVDHIQHLVTLGGSRGQVLIATGCDEDVIFDANTTNWVVCLEEVFVNELGM